MAEKLNIAESTLTRIPPDLEQVIQKFVNDKEPKETRKNNLFVAVLYVLMLESGFESSDDYKSWKTNFGAYVIKFTFQGAPDIRVLLMANPLDGVMLINVSIPELISMTAYSVCITIGRHIVSPYAPQPSMIFRDLNDLSMKFKDSIANPARCTIMNRYGIPNPSLLGIPINLQWKICCMLSIRDVGRLSCTCNRMRTALSDDTFWKMLLRYHFHSSQARTVTKEPDDEWKTIYKACLRSKNK